jgi:uncharacterized protein YidB (DUF937 family)
MTGLDDLLKGLQKGQGGGAGGLGDVLGGVLGQGGGGGGLGGIFGQILKGGGGGGVTGGAGGGPMGGIMKMLLPILMGMLAGGGLKKVLGGMRSSGLSSQADSWVGTGENHPIQAHEVSQVLGADQIAEIAQRLGVPEDRAAEVIAEVLPSAIDHLTPEGVEPEDQSIDSALGQLKSLWGA